MLDSLGLVGDGDEIAAVEDVERAFGVKLDYGEAASWRTVGDVHAALTSALSPEQRAAPDLWPRFAQAISDETGVDPDRIGPATLLLSQGGFSWLAAAVLIAIVAAIFLVTRWW